MGLHQSINPNGSSLRSGASRATTRQLQRAATSRLLTTTSVRARRVQLDTWYIANTTDFELNDSISLRNVIASVVNNSRTRHRRLADSAAGDRALIDNKQFRGFQVLGTPKLNWIVGGYYFLVVRTRSIASRGVDPAIQPEHIACIGLSNPGGGGGHHLRLLAQGTYTLDSMLRASRSKPAPVQLG